MSDYSSSVITVKLRVSPELKEKIELASKENNRSMNAEMVLRLQQSFLEYPSENAERILQKAEFFLAEAMNMRSQVSAELDKIQKIAQELKK